MGQTSLPSKTDASIGRVKTDRVPPTSLNTQVSAAEYERLKTALIDVATEVGVHTGAAGDLNTRTAALETSVTALEASAQELTVVAPGAPGATANVNQNAVAGEKNLWNISSPAGEPADASAPYYLHITNGVDAEDVIVVGRAGAARTLAAALEHSYNAGPSTVAYAGLATSPASAGLMPAADKHVLDATVEDVDAHLADATNPHGTTLQQAYTAGRSIDASVGPIEIDTPAPDGSSRAITTYANGLRAAALTPQGLASAQPILVAPEDQPAGNDGWPIVVRGGNGGAGASLGGTVQVQAGEVLGGGQDGDVLIGTEHASAIQIGKTGDGSSVQITGDLSVQSGSGGAKTAAISAAQPTPAAIVLAATDPAGGISLRVDGTEVLGVTSGKAQITGTLKRKIAVRTVAANTVLTADDQVVIVDASGGPITLTAPDPAGLYEPILILKKSTGANAINVATPSGQINGAASPQALPDSTSTLRPSWTLFADGTDTWSA